MARKIETLFIDDLDGTEAAGTILFALEGTQYEIDLSTSHASDLRAALAPYVHAGRTVPGARRSPRNNPARSPDSADIRNWARAHSIEIKDRGRIPADISARYQADKD
jgi:hypothetical protein